MTRARDHLVLSRGVFGRRYGTDMPEDSVPSRFLEEVPSQLPDVLGTPRSRRASVHADSDSAGVHYRYEDEGQSAVSGPTARQRTTARQKPRSGGYSGPKYNSIENIAEFFASRGKK